MYIFSFSWHTSSHCSILQNTYITCGRKVKEDEKINTFRELGCAKGKWFVNGGIDLEEQIWTSKAVSSYTKDVKLGMFYNDTTIPDDMLV